jgi:hypothetical protein
MLILNNVEDLHHLRREQTQLCGGISFQLENSKTILSVLKRAKIYFI